MQTLPERVMEMLPAPEPKPHNGFRLQVSYPYISPDSRQKVLNAIDNGTISSATSVVAEFEEELKDFFGVSFAKACSSGYSALVLALKLASITEGDDVLIPSFTMAAVMNSVITVGARPVFVDCEQGKFNPSVSEYAGKVTPSTKALIVCHTYGIPADCAALQGFCKSNGFIFIEDIAEAIGTEFNGHLVGRFGDFACASLYANKTITSGDGGFVLSNNETKTILKDRANSYTNHGFSKQFHFLHFEHSGNYKMSGLQAAFVMPAVKNIPEIMEDRRRIAELYRKQLDSVSGLKLMPLNPFGKDAPWMFGVLADNKQKRTYIRRKLADMGIETRDFFFPLHLQPMIIQNLKSPPDVLPNAECLGTCGFYLPTFYGLREDIITDICTCLKKAVLTECENGCAVVVNGSIDGTP